MNTKIEPCPHCGRKARVSFRQIKFIGPNEVTGQKRIRWIIQVICNRCKSRGKPISLETTVNLWTYPHFHGYDPSPLPWIELAISEWNAKAPHWRNPETDPPAYGERVIVCVGSSFVCEAYNTPRGFERYGDVLGTLPETLGRPVTGWMPMPKSQKECEG